MTDSQWRTRDNFVIIYFCKCSARKSEHSRHLLFSGIMTALKVFVLLLLTLSRVNCERSKTRERGKIIVSEIFKIFRDNSQRHPTTTEWVTTSTVTSSTPSIQDSMMSTSESMKSVTTSGSELQISSPTTSRTHMDRRTGATSVRTAMAVVRAQSTWKNRQRDRTPSVCR